MGTTAIDEVMAWLERAVIGHNLCPFAAGARRNTRILSVPGDDDAVIGCLIDEARALLAQPDDAPHTTLLVLETCGAKWSDFLDLIATVDTILDHTGLRGRLQLAHFHPEYRFEGEDERTAWTNRAPRPVLHLLREADVTVAVSRHPDAAAIPARNIEHVLGLADPKAAFWGP